MDETKHEVTFTYVDDKTPVIEVIQKVTNEKLPEDTPSVSNPKTGDDTNLWFPALCLILSTGGLIGMGVHSPDERMLIPTVDKFWKHLLDILANVPVKK